MAEAESRGGRGRGGGSDDNVIRSGGGDDRLTGTSRYDTVDLTSESIRGSVFTANGAETVHRHGGQTNTYQNIEELRFLDGRIVLDPNDPAAQVVRLYKACLGREADQGGLNYWIDRLEQGGKLSDLGEAFLRSPEYAARFGAPDNASYVDRLYQNILGRPGDVGGKAFWLGRIQAGVSRQDVLVGFSESEENKVGTRGTVAAGIWDRSENAGQIARLYDTVFGRLPDAGGLAGWRAGLDNGSTKLEDVAGAFTRSAEFVAKYGALNNRNFVESLYRNALGRASDDGGARYWTQQLDAGGLSRAGMVVGFSESGEHVARTAPQFENEDPSRYGITLAR